MDQLTKEIAYKNLQDFFINKPFVFLGTGASCAVDPKYSMQALQEYLLSEMSKKGLEEYGKEWDSVVKSLRQGSDLESAMNNIQNENLTRRIIFYIAKHLIGLDKKHSFSILSGDKTWPSISLFKKLIRGLPETDRILHVATTNYDLMAEYAYEYANIPYSTGYSGGILRRLNWELAEKMMKNVETIPDGKKYRKVFKYRKHICLYKVHGSLNIFKYNSSIVENNTWIYKEFDLDMNINIERVMITPGVIKHKLLNDNRTALLGQFDQAIEKHNAFLFIGFGFNDSQIYNNAIKNKLTEQNCPALIITMDENSNIKKILNNSENLWLVCKQKEIEENTCVFNKKYDVPLILKNKQLWKVDIFTKEILGE
jgi:hypothetical protein